MTLLKDNLNKLPEKVALWADQNNTPYLPWEKPANARPIVVQAGDKGYWLAPPRLNVDHFNSQAGKNGEPATKAQIAAMMEGSVFGFHCPIANPDEYNEDGVLHTAKNQKASVSEMAGEVVKLVGGDAAHG